MGGYYILYLIILTFSSLFRGCWTVEPVEPGFLLPTPPVEGC